MATEISLEEAEVGIISRSGCWLADSTLWGLGDLGSSLCVAAN